MLVVGRYDGCPCRDGARCGGARRCEPFAVRFRRSVQRTIGLRMRRTGGSSRWSRRAMVARTAARECTRECQGAGAAAAGRWLSCCGVMRVAVAVCVRTRSAMLRDRVALRQQFGRLRCCGDATSPPRRVGAYNSYNRYDWNVELDRASSRKRSNVHVERCAAVAMYMSSNAIDVKVTGAVGTIVLNRPERRNALTRAMLAQLQEALERLAPGEAGAGDRAHRGGHARFAPAWTCTKCTPPQRCRTPRNTGLGRHGRGLSRARDADDRAAQADHRLGERPGRGGRGGAGAGERHRGRERRPPNSACPNRGAGSWPASSRRCWRSASAAARPPGCCSRRRCIRPRKRTGSASTTS